MGIVTIASREEAWSASQIKLKRQVLATKWSPGGRFVVFTGQNQVRPSKFSRTSRCFIDRLYFIFCL